MSVSWLKRLLYVFMLSLSKHQVLLSMFYAESLEAPDITLYAFMRLVVQLFLWYLYFQVVFYLSGFLLLIIADLSILYFI
jgi:hypothetical protein